MPNRPDKRDYITLASSILQFHPEPVNGVFADDIDKKAYPSNWDHGKRPGEMGAWRAHMNVLQRIVQDRISTAFIMEDDADWDVNLKKQLQRFASASQLVRGDTRPSHSPYGDSWDLLWIGHCGVAFKTGPIHVTTDDTTVVPLPELPRYWHGFPAGADNGTRLVARLHDGVCSLGYAITYLGAQKILSGLSLTPQGDGAPFDVAIGRFCQNDWLRCIAPFPSLIGLWKAAGPKARGSDIHDDDGWIEKETPVGTVYSAMYNAGRLLNSERTVHAVLEDTPAHEIDPTKLELPEGTLKMFDNTGIHEIIKKSI
ncbi:hypothetical protein BDV27DRAFT_116054 [Aspergillus caelatus]|uniref:Glycosyltransferase family 25 protein n=1 Tax=Aspergillus caelatus TaxID=61420 RepID=A0A5N7A309_9EURO|nr:uncharacterized protein BDV27DRAFT_116054 [Aspergillus caelatus]KAE8364254.1 hypothetical protein BDV27DRAFT_116054 [Aspergillus caelatus]